MELEESAFEMIDIIVNNSNYSPEYLKKIYFIDLYRIFRKVSKQIKQRKNG